MDWFLFMPWVYEAPVGGPPDRSGRSPAGSPGTAAGGDTGPTAVDVWLLRVTYELVAADATCAACHAPLGRGLRVVPVTDGDPAASWRVSVTTRCRGWRRHPHVAAVTRPGPDLVLGALRRY